VVELWLCRQAAFKKAEIQFIDDDESGGISVRVVEEKALMG
jgi:hypothetical protein